MIIGDKGYSYPSLRRFLNRRGIRPVIPARCDQRQVRLVDHMPYRDRNKIERLVNRLKRHRRIATRFDKLAVQFEGWVTLASLLEWLTVERTV